MVDTPNLSGDLSQEARRVPCPPFPLAFTGPSTTPWFAFVASDTDGWEGVVRDTEGTG